MYTYARLEYSTQCKKPTALAQSAPIHRAGSTVRHTSLSSVVEYCTILSTFGLKYVISIIIRFDLLDSTRFALVPQSISLLVIQYSKYLYILHNTLLLYIYIYICTGVSKLEPCVYCVYCNNRVQVHRSTRVDTSTSCTCTPTYSSGQLVLVV
jgi:hypothetical protein